MNVLKDKMYYPKHRLFSGLRVPISKALTIFFCTLLVVSTAYAQGGEPPKEYQFLPPSPTAAALGSYGEVPLNHSTGVPNISVPLTEFKVFDFSVPISLSYRSDGCRVNDVASWVGLGWSLNAGGVITRTIRGNDDINPGTQRAQVFPLEDGSNNLQSYINLVSDIFYHDPASGNLDTEPDLFNYNFLGFTGQFMLDATGNPVLLETGKFDIVSIMGYDAFTPYVSSHIIGFKITTHDGVVYTFAGEGNSTQGITSQGTEYSRSISNASTIVGSNTCSPEQNPYDVPLPTSWYLKSISTKSNETINFQYTSNFYSYIANRTESISYFQGVDKWHHRGVGQPALGSSGIRSACARQFDFTTAVPVSISASSQYGELTFVPAIDRLDLEGTRLYRIEEKSSQGNNIRTFEFEIKHNTVGQPKMFLEKVTESNGSELKSHSFEYNSIEGLPDLTSPDQDRWGFYNNAGNTEMIEAINKTVKHPGFFNAARSHTAFRGPDLTATKKGVIKKIIYPTGGSTTFEYELNRSTWKTPNYYKSYDPASGQFSDDNTPSDEEFNFSKSHDLVQYVNNDNVLFSDLNSILLFPKTQTVNMKFSTILDRLEIDNASFNPWVFARFRVYEAIISVDGQLNPTWTRGDQILEEEISFMDLGISPENWPDRLDRYRDIQLEYEQFDINTYRGYEFEMISTGGIESVINFTYNDGTSNTYNNPDGDVVEFDPAVGSEVGGLRVSKAIADDGGENQVITKYEYQPGSLVRTPHYDSEYTLSDSDAPYGGAFAFTELYAKLSSNPVKSTTGSHGSHILYTNVTVIRGENGQGGKSIFRYEMQSDLEADMWFRGAGYERANYLSPSSFDLAVSSPTLNVGLLNGKELEVIHYDKEGNVLQETRNFYRLEIDYENGFPALAYARTSPANLDGVLRPEYTCVEWGNPFDEVESNDEDCWICSTTPSKFPTMGPYLWCRPYPGQYIKEYNASTGKYDCLSCVDAVINTASQAWAGKTFDDLAIDIYYTYPYRVDLATVVSTMDGVENITDYTYDNYYPWVTETETYTRNGVGTKQNIRKSFLRYAGEEWGSANPAKGNPVRYRSMVEGKIVSDLFLKYNTDGQLTHFYTNEVESHFGLPNSLPYMNTSSADMEAQELDKYRLSQQIEYAGGKPSTIHNKDGTVTTIYWEGDRLLSSTTGNQTITYGYNTKDQLEYSQDANGKRTYYEYDDLGRLEIIKDYVGNPLKKYIYSYKN